MVDHDVRDGDKVYVVLTKKGKFWEVKKLQKIKPKQRGEMFIKGIVVHGGIPESVSERRRRIFIRKNLTIKYGIENYFIPEGRGVDYRFRRGRNHAKVSVDDDGNAVIAQIYVDGNPWP